MDKTEFICFSKNGGIKLDVYTKNSYLEQVPLKRLVGVIFYERLAQTDCFGTKLTILTNSVWLHYRDFDYIIMICDNNIAICDWATSTGYRSHSNVSRLLLE